MLFRRVAASLQASANQSPRPGPLPVWSQCPGRGPECWQSVRLTPSHSGHFAGGATQGPWGTGTPSGRAQARFVPEWPGAAYHLVLPTFSPPTLLTSQTDPLFRKV